MTFAKTLLLIIHPRKGMLSLICAAGLKMHLKLFFLLLLVVLPHQPLLAFVADLALLDFDDIRLEVLLLLHHFTNSLHMLYES